MTGTSGLGKQGGALDDRATSGVSDHRVEVKIEEHVDILPAGPPVGLMRMARLPDGAIYLNTQSWGMSSRALLKSSDGCRTWQPVALRFNEPGMWPSQTTSTIGATRDGTLWAITTAAGSGFHGGVKSGVENPWPDDKPKPVWVARSPDGGRTWRCTRLDFAHLSPEGPQAPYVLAYPASNFIERPDGTVMFTIIAYYRDQLKAEGEDDLACFLRTFQSSDPSRQGVREVMVRTRDGGATWGDATTVRQQGTGEIEYAVDPKDPGHILAMARKQQAVLPGEDRETVYRQARCPIDVPFPYKGGQLMESTDGGTTFCEVPNAYTGFYGHRMTICWTERDVLIATHRFPSVTETRALARISLDGGRTWVDGTKGGTSNFEESRTFVFNPDYAGTTPTIEVEPNRYFTAYMPAAGGLLSGFFWHLEDASGGGLRLACVKPRS